MAQEKTQMNGGRGVDEGGSEEINGSETNGAIPKNEGGSFRYRNWFLGNRLSKCTTFERIAIAV